MLLARGALSLLSGSVTCALAVNGPADVPRVFAVGINVGHWGEVTPTTIAIPEHSDSDDFSVNTISPFAANVIPTPYISNTSAPTNVSYASPYPEIPGLTNTTSPPYSYPLNISSTNPHLSKAWRSAYIKAQHRLTNWTLEQKVTLTTGTGWEIGRCVGNIPSIPEQNFTGLCLEDSPLGVRFADFVSAFPAGINVASTFDKDLMYKRGYAMGEEFRGKGVNVALGPMTNMGRVAAGGRNWEGFGGDPYLSGWATEMTVKGMQDAGVQACVKHYIGNEQEHFRTTSSSNIPSRALHEIYSHPFLRAVQADVASVMCSYNLVNNSWACQNSETLNGILKTDYGFPGYVMSDWQATESGVSAVNSGLDMTMPGDIVFGSLTSYFGGNLTEAVKNGSVEMERVDDMALRILAGFYLLGQDQDYPEVNFDAFRRGSGENNSHVDVRGEHRKLIKHIGEASTVLLKNVNKTLPLHYPKSIALIGADLGQSILGPNGCADRGCVDGTLAMGWGSGTADFPYLVDPLCAISHRARYEGSTLNWHLDNFDLAGVNITATGPEVVIVGVNSDSGEQYITVDGNEGDRNNLSAWLNGDEVVLNAAANNNNTIVVVHSVGPMDMEKWIDHPNITAVLWAGLPGQESGGALVSILYGDYNPSARLPYTIAKNRSDYPADVVYTSPDEPAHLQIDYNEELHIDYRHFLARNITPRFEFGFGLSYTRFNYTNLQIWDIRDQDEQNGHGEGQAAEHEGATSRNRTVGRFVRPELHKPRWTVSADIQNIGELNGCEIPQLYLSYPESAGEPPRVLRDFTRINLDPWQAQRIYFNLSRYDVSFYDVVMDDRGIPNGNFTAIVAKSSLDRGVTGVFCPGGTC